MSLSRRVLFNVGIVFLVLLVTLYIAAQTIVLNSYKTLEEESMQRNVARVENKLDDNLANLVSTNTDWAHWDDTYEFVQNPADSTYAEDNLSDVALANLGINMMIFVNQAGEIAYSQTVDLATSTARPLPLGIEDDLPLLTTMRDETSVNSGLIMTSEGAMLTSALPILTDEKQGPIAGVLIFGRFLDTDEVTALSESLELPLRFYDFNGELPSEIRDIRAELEDTESVVQPLQDQKRIGGYAVLSDIHNQPTLILRVDTARDIVEQGKKSITFFTLAVSIMGLVAGAVIFLVLQKIVLARLKRLGNDVARIRTAGDSQGQVRVEGDDELSQLATRINDMLSSLDQSANHLRASNERIQALLNNSPILLWTFDAERRLTYLGGSPLDVLPLDPTAILGKFLMELSQPELPFYKQDVERAFQGKTSVATVQINDLSFESYCLPDKQSGGVIGVSVNISERRKAEKAVETKDVALERVRSLMDSTLLQLSDTIARGANREELSTYVRSIRKEFDKLDQ